MKMITFPEARRDFAHGLIGSFDLVPLPSGVASVPFWSVLVQFNHQPRSEYLRAVNSDVPRQFKTLDAAISQIQQIAGSVDLPRFSIPVINGGFQK